MPEMHLPAWYSEPSLRDFTDLYNRKGARLLLFVGSGLSRGAGFPSWEELLHDLASRASSKLGVEITKKFQELVARKRYASAGSWLFRKFKERGGSYEKVWRENLDDIFQIKPDRQVESAVHRRLADLNWDTIITTNFDCMIEQSLRESKLDFDLTYPHSGSFQRSSSTFNRLVVKLHGDIAQPGSRIILTKEDYEDFYKSDEPVGKSFRDTLQVLLQRATTILFIGYSHDDPYLQELINPLNFPRESLPPAFALTPLPSEQYRKAFFQRTRDLALRTGITAISYDNKDGSYGEFRQFFEYLSDQESHDRVFGAIGSVRQPTVVLLYTGGTISATVKDPESDALDLPRISSRFDPGLEQRSKDLLETYRRFYYSDVNPSFELQWETLEQSDQILSENASVDHWNNILAKLDDIFYKYFRGPDLIAASGARIQDPRLEKIFKSEAVQYRKQNPLGDFSEAQFIKDFKGRYVAGIIVLHGTDTLAYTAAALNFSMEGLPCPVILTGANQPPDKEPLVEDEPEFWESDTWKNLATSLYFLQCIGHRYTEIFVCFGETINHGPNLRKIPLEMVPVRREAVRRQRVEPFGFRNFSLRRQYVFRCIEGVFCNNYYPLYLRKQNPGAEEPFLNFSYSDIRAINDKVRHLRENPFEGSPGRLPQIRYFEHGVVALKVNPMWPEIAVKDWGRRDREGGSIRVVLIEGYKSGTYPTRESHRFADFLLGLYNEGIPVILIARYGIHPTSNEYATSFIRGQRVPVVRLFGVIMETALPLVAFVVGGIPEEKWWNLGEVLDVTKERSQMVRKEISEFLRGRENIVTLDLGDCTDRLALRGRNEKLIEDELHSDHLRRQMNMDPIARIRFEPRESEAGKAWGSGRLETYLQTEILRGDFLWLLGELIRPLEKAGSAPDGFAVISDMGFDWGFYGVEGFYKDKGWRTDGITFSSRASEDREPMIEKASAIVESVRVALTDRGMSRVEAGGSEGVQTRLPDENNAREIGKFWFEVIVQKGNEKPQHEERYSIQHYSDAEAEFFRALIREMPIRKNSDLAKRYEALEKASWRQLLSDVDWFVLGAFKGVACSIASYLQFDELCAGPWDPQQRKARIRAIREGTRIEVLPNERSSFRLRVTYYARRGRPRRRATDLLS